MNQNYKHQNEPVSLELQTIIMTADTHVFGLERQIIQRNMKKILSALII